MAEKYKCILTDKHIIPTVQRIMILEFLDKNRIHPTADQVYEGLRNNMITLSKATVYNTLNKFVENGLVNDLSLFEKETRYEYNVINHIHFKCKKCGKIFDLPANDIINNNDNFEGFKILDYQINLRGICKECLEEKG